MFMELVDASHVIRRTRASARASRLRVTMETSITTRLCSESCCVSVLAPAQQFVLHQRLQGEEVGVRVLGQQRPHSLGQFQQILRVLPAGTRTADDLAGDLLQRGGAQEVGMVPRADVKQRLAGRGGERRTGVKGHSDGLVPALFSVVQVTLHFLFPACGQLVGDSPNAALRKREDIRPSKTGASYSATNRQVRVLTSGSSTRVTTRPGWRQQEKRH